MADITVIPGNQCIGDSLATINNNFAALNNFVLPLTTTVQLTSKDSTINLLNKAHGKIVFNTTDNKVYVARGSLNTNIWNVVDNSSSITPA